ncbi:hypothetical protein ACHAQA_009329 [Verticillium albo-atrum]
MPFDAPVKLTLAPTLDRKLECIYKGQDVTSRRYASDYVRQLEDHVKSLSNRLESQERQQPDPQKTTDTHEASNLDSTTLSFSENHDSTWPEAEAETVMEDERVPSDYDAIPTPCSTSTRLAGEHEVSGVNRHTRNVEFYGTSSSVALLSHIQRNTGQDNETADDAHALLVTSLHNPSFHSPDTNPTRADAGAHSRPHHSAHSRSFLDNYFSAIHYVHPILDKKIFLQRCENMWSGEEGTSVSSFAALYYSVLSLGALVGVRPDEPLDGISNLQWSRKFFDQAKNYCNQLGMATDLEMVQCYFFLAKVCQNELSPHLCYMYVGLAVRTALAMGINRVPGPNTRSDPAKLKAESRTWWFYNTTYTVFAASIILVHVTREPSDTDNHQLLERVGMAIEILEIMDECVVASEAAKLLRQAKEKAERAGPSASNQAINGFEGTMLLNHYWGPLDLLGGDMDLDFAFQLADLDAPVSSLMASDHQ